VRPDLLVLLRRDPLQHLVVLVHVDAPEEVVVGPEPEPVLRVRELVVLGHQLDDPGGMPLDGLLADQRGRRLGVVPLLDADQQLEVAVAEIRAEEVLVALRVAEAPGPARRRRPQPLLILVVARREMEEARVLDVRRRREAQEGAVLAAGVGLLGHVDLARAGERPLVPGLHGRGGGAVVPGGEAVPLLGRVDDFAAGHRACLSGERDECGERTERETTNHSSNSWEVVTRPPSGSPPTVTIQRRWKASAPSTAMLPR